MSSPSPALRLHSPSPPPPPLHQPFPKSSSLRPAHPSCLHRPNLPCSNPFRPSRNKPYKLPRSSTSRRLIPLAINLTAGNPDDPSKKLDVDGMLHQARKLFDDLPHPVKIFPWTKALGNFFHLLLDLVLAVAKYLSVPMLALSSLSEMSYCAHERKMVLIPIPFLVGFAIAGALKEAAVELSSDLKVEGFPWHLLLIGIFFTLLKLPGPYYPYWGRLLIPHFANGGLWRTVWYAFMWYRRPRSLLE